MKKKASIAGRIWWLIFGCWAILLSGALAGIGGSPGVIQAVQLDRLLQAREEQAHVLEREVQELDEERLRLLKNRAAQEREVRRVLGYVASDELIFEFSAP